jgi:hypothetical protein
MNTFKDREKTYEAKYVHDQETNFKINARRNKLLGQWAAELLGLSGAAADDYAKEVVKSDFQRAGDDDVAEKLLGDFKAKGVEMTESRLRAEMRALLEEARRQVTSE